MITVVNRTPCMRRLPGNLILEPGANEVTDEKWAAAQCEHVDHLIRLGKLRIEEPPTENKTLADEPNPTRLSDLRREDALAAIEACTDPEQLLQWLDSEPRKRMRSALVSRHHALRPPNEDE